MTETLAETLTARKSTHGDSTEHADCTQTLKATVHEWANWEALSPVQKEAIEMILHKIGRIMTGNPDHHDHWIDIAGYAQLVADRVQK